MSMSNFKSMKYHQILATGVLSFSYFQSLFQCSSINFQLCNMSGQYQILKMKRDWIIQENSNKLRFQSSNGYNAEMSLQWSQFRLTFIRLFPSSRIEFPIQMQMQWINLITSSHSLVRGSKFETIYLSPGNPSLCSDHNKRNRLKLMKFELKISWVRPKILHPAPHRYHGYFQGLLSKLTSVSVGSSSKW